MESIQNCNDKVGCKPRIKLKSQNITDNKQKIMVKIKPKEQQQNVEKSVTSPKIQAYKCVKLPLKKILHKQSNDPDKRVEILIEKTSIHKQSDDPDKREVIPIEKTSMQIQAIDNLIILQKINETVIRTNKIIIKTYLLLRLWILYKYQQQPDTLAMNKNIIKLAIQVICSQKDATRKTKVKKCQVPSDEQKKQFKDQCYQELQQLNPFTPENAKHLSHILEHQTTVMLTSIENNVKCHFHEYLKRYVKTILENQYPESLIDTNSKKQFGRDLYKVKDDFLNNRLPSQYQSDSKFHEWMTQQKSKILPLLDPSETYYEDVYENPTHYLRYMIQMNQEIDRLGCAMFQFFPLRTDLIPKHIQIDTSVLIDLFIDQDVGESLANVQKCQDALWSTFFRIKPCVKNYQFDHAIITDGVSVSYRLIHYLEKIKKQRQYEAMKNGRELTRECRKQGIDKPPKEKPKRKPKQSKVSKPPEFSYIDEVPRADLEGDHAFCDGGKKKSLISDQ